MGVSCAWSDFPVQGVDLGASDLVEIGSEALRSGPSSAAGAWEEGGEGRAGSSRGPGKR